MRKRIIALLFSFAFIMGFSNTAPEKVSAAGKKFNMSYIYFGSPDNFTGYVEKTQGPLDEVAPAYFGLTESGCLSISSIYKPAFVNDMHRMGVKVVPFLSNNWDRQRGRNALARRNELADEIVNAVKKMNLDGVNIDIENLTEQDRDNYTDFIRILRARLPADKSLSIAVAANPKGINIGWAGSYDYTALAKYCDYLMVMAYDESYGGSPPGPVASIKFVEDSIKYAVSKAPADKVVLGVPFYGRYWNHAESYGGYGIGVPDIERLIEKYSARVFFDPVSMSPYTVVTLKKPEEIFNGLKTMQPGTYTIWFEKKESLIKKLNLVAKYDIKGTGSWSLSQEPSGIWKDYKIYLNGIMFDDIKDNWALNSILSVVNKGWMNGVSMTEFGPHLVTTRAQVAAVLVRALGLDDQPFEPHPFKDIAGHWAEKEISIAWKNNFMTGLGEDIFGPDSPMTREQMAVTVDRIFNPPLRFEVSYSDVTIDSCPWSYDAIRKTSSINVFSGFPDGTFRPKASMNRAQLSAILEKLSPQISLYRIIKGT